MLHFKMKMKYR